MSSLPDGAVRPVVRAPDPVLSTRSVEVDPRDPEVVALAADLLAKHHGNARPGVPGETPWGTREITITDPASNRLTFYTPTTFYEAVSAPQDRHDA